MRDNGSGNAGRRRYSGRCGYDNIGNGGINKLLEKAGRIPLIQPRTRYSIVEKDVITPGESGDTAQFEESEEWPDWSDWDDWSDFGDSSEDIIEGFAEGSGSIGRFADTG